MAERDADAVKGGAWTLRAWDVLAARAAERPHAEALVTATARWTWADLARAVRRRAGAMLALGLGRGDRVAVLMPNTEEWVATFLAAAAIGAVTVPVNTRFRAAEIADALGRARCRAVFAADRFRSQDFSALLREAEPALDRALPGMSLPELRHAVVVGEDVPAAAMPHARFLALSVPDRELEAAVAAVSAEDPLLIQFTSGTTARPKGAVLTHHSMLRNAACAAARIGVVPEDRYLNCRPFFHVAGSTLTLLVCLSTGACLVTPPAFAAPDAARLLAEEGCTLTSGNDTIFQMLMSEPTLDRARLRLRGGWAAAGPVTMRRIMAELGAASVCNAYGLSEASPNVGMSDAADAPEDRAEGWLLPHDGLEVRIADPGTGAPRPAGEPGEIRVRGWSLMRGYDADPENTAKAVAPDGWLRTGDLGVADARGRFRMAGRLKDVFRVGGENVAPAEVEEALQAHPDVAVAQVVGVPDARLGEVPAAFVLPRAGASPDPAAVLDWLRPRVAGFRLPRHLWVVEGFEAIGMTASGKVQKVRLREEALRRMRA